MQHNKDFHSRYQVIAPIGQGQFGQVYCARRKGDRQLVALKYLDRTRCSTVLFLKEVNLLTGLDNPYIVGCEGIESDSSSRILVLEYCEGGSLREIIDSKYPLTLSEKLKLILDTLIGLQYLHEKNIVHRDLKPENILLKLTPEGWQTLLSDFGFSRSLQERYSNNDEIDAAGTLPYSAPEQFYSDFSYQSDLYSVGIILYELILGTRPFSGQPKDIISAHFNQQIELSKDIPFLVRRVIHKTLEKLPGKRYKSASQMRQALKLAFELSVAEQAVKPTITPQTFQGDQTFIQCDHRIKRKQAGRLVGCTRELLFLQAERTLYTLNVSNLKTRNSEDLESGSVTSRFYHSAYQITAINDQDLENNDSCKIVNTLKPEQSWEKKGRMICTALSLSGQWMAACVESHSQDKCISYKLYLISTATFQTVRCVDFPLRPKALFISSDRHLAAIFESSDARNGDRECTQIQCYTRRGTTGDAYTLPFGIDKITTSLSHDLRLLALNRKLPSCGVLVELSPYKVKRLFFEFEPDIILGNPQGFIVLNKIGQLSQIDREGQISLTTRLSLDKDEYIREAILTAGNRLIIESSNKETLCLRSFSILSEE